MDQLAKACPVPIIGGFGGSENASEAAMSEDDDDDDDDDEAMEEGESVAGEVLQEESGVKSRKTSRVRTTISDEQVSVVHYTSIA